LRKFKKCCKFAIVCYTIVINRKKYSCKKYLRKKYSRRYK